MTSEGLDAIFADDAKWDALREHLNNLHTVVPVSPDYPGDGTCYDCGQNNWGIWKGICLCTNCGSLDA